MNFAILRAFECLPERCGFDLDILVETGHVSHASAAAVIAGQEAGLLAYVQQKSGRSAKVMWLDPRLNPTQRQWLLLDISSDLAFGPHRLEVGDITTENWQNDSFHCPVPTEDWRLTLAVLRGLTGAGNLPPDTLVSTQNFPHLSRILGKPAVSALSNLSSLESTKLRAKAIAKWREEYRFNVSPRLFSYPKATARKHLSRFIFFRLFLWERHRPPFIVITGADGVGKTTLISHLEVLLSQYPMDFDIFHHLTAMKTTNWQPEREKSLIGVATKPRFNIVRKIAQIIWRFLVPSWLQQAIVGINGELRYASRLNFKIGTSFFSGRASLIDRYVFDRLIRLEIDQRHPLQKWVGHLNCRFMRRPRLAILLSDTPERIHARKDQFNIDTIQHYEKRLRLLIGHTQTPMAELRVADKMPEDLAQEGLRLTLDSLGPDVPALVAAWDRTHRKSHKNKQAVP